VSVYARLGSNRRRRNGTRNVGRSRRRFEPINLVAGGIQRDPGAGVRAAGKAAFKPPVASDADGTEMVGGMPLEEGSASIPLSHRVGGLGAGAEYLVCGKRDLPDCCGS